MTRGHYLGIDLPALRRGVVTEEVLHGPVFALKADQKGFGRELVSGDAYVPEGETELQPLVDSVGQAAAVVLRVEAVDHLGEAVAVGAAQDVFGVEVVEFLSHLLAVAVLFQRVEGRAALRQEPLRDLFGRLLDVRPVVLLDVVGGHVAAHRVPADEGRALHFGARLVQLVEQEAARLFQVALEALQPVFHVRQARARLGVESRGNVARLFSQAALDGLVETAEEEVALILRAQLKLVEAARTILFYTRARTPVAEGDDERELLPHPREEVDALRGVLKLLGLLRDVRQLLPRAFRLLMHALRLCVIVLMLRAHERLEGSEAREQRLDEVARRGNAALPEAGVERLRKVAQDAALLLRVVEPGAGAPLHLRAYLRRASHPEGVEPGPEVRGEDGVQWSVLREGGGDHLVAGLAACDERVD